MKAAKVLVIFLFTVICLGSMFANVTRTVDPLIMPQWHQTDPWNGRCPGTGANRAHAGSHALALAKVMKYWAYPTYGTGSVSYIDDDYGPINQSFTGVLNWNGMSNTLIFQTTLRFIFLAGASVFTNYEVAYSTSSLTNVQNSLLNYFNYSTDIQYRNRSAYTNFYWKSLIRQELDAARPVIYSAVLSNGNEVAFIIDGYDEEGLFHINWSDVNYPNSWVDLNTLSVWGQTIGINNQFMLTGVSPSLGPDNIDENFETDFNNFNWQFSGQASWEISTESAYYGSKSAKSGNINHNQSSSMFIEIDVTEPDIISFYKRVSCEAEPNHLYDHLAFFIDGVEMQRWSGDGSWEYHEYPVSAGVHQFRWTYSKDGASVYFNDCAWVDAVDLPEGTTPLNPPLFTEAQVLNGNDIELNWSPPEGTNPTLVGYRIYRNGIQQVQYNNPALTLYVDYTMPNGDYSYYVRAVYSEGISNPGNSSSVTVEIPYAPENLTVVLSGVNSALLEWQAPPLLRDRVLMGYQVYRDNVVIAQVENPEALQYIDAGLAEGVYYYEITAMYSAGESARSNMAQLAVGVPNPPSNFQAVVNGSTVNLSWSQVPDTTFLTGFKLFRNGAMIANLSNPMQLNYSDQNLLNGAYSYIVRAVYGDVDSGNSLPANVYVEVPYPPTNVSVSVIQDDVQLSWTNPQLVRALTHYYIYRDGQIIAAVFNPNTTTYLDQNLANGIYTYTITAVYSGTESLPSAPVQALVEVLYPPTNLAANVSLADVALTWTIPVNQGGLTRSFNGYNVFRDGVLVDYVSGGTVNHYMDYSVPNGLYTYTVTAVYSTGESTPASVSGVLVEVLYPVTVLSFDVDDDDVTLMWSAAATAPGRDASDRAFTAYKVYRDGEEIAQTTTLNYVDADLSNGIYQYYVTALYGSGESIPSPVITVHLEVLYPPTALIATVQDDDVSLEWTSPATSGGLGRAFIEYQVHRDGALIFTTQATQYTDPDLSNGTYQYQVYAVYDSGISAASNTALALVEVLYPPRNLVHSVVNRYDVMLSWQVPLNSGGIRAFEEYDVYRDGILIAETPNTFYTDPALADGSYSYYVTAIYGSGASLPTPSVTAFIEYPYPPAFVAANVVDADVFVSWDVVLGTQVLYHLYRDGVLIAAISDTSYVDAGLDNGSYDYYVISSNASESGMSDPSMIVNAIVNVPYPPRNLSGNVAADTISLSWQAPLNGPRELLHYRIYRDGLLLDTTTALVYDDAGLSNGDYSYYVTAQYDLAESVPSNIVVLSVEVFYPATNLSYIVNGDDVSLIWTAAVNSGGLRAIQGYKIYRDDIEIAQVIGTDYLDSDLANGIYDYYVVAVYETGVSAPSNTVTAMVEVLYPPSNLSSMTNDDDIILSWNAAPISARGFLGYNVYRDGMFIALVNALTYTDAALANGTYQYYVTALYDSGESLPTNTVTVNLEVLYPATNLSAIVNGDDVTLNWTAAATSGGLRSFIAYKVMRENVEIAQTTSLTYLDADLSNGIYQYTIIASYDSGDALASNQVEVLVEVLYQPTNLSYMVVGDRVDLSWIAAPNSARALLGYNVYRDGNLIALEQTLNYSDLDLANGVYQYYVTALYGSGESLPTNTVTATVEVLYPPTVLTYSVSDDDVTLYWNAAATSGGLRAFLGYNIYRDSALISQTLNLSYVDNNLVNGFYQFHVTALYDSGESDPTNSINVLVEVFYPATNLTHLVNGDDVSLNWTAAVSSGGLRAIQGYKVYRDNTEIAQVIGTNYLDSDLSNGIYDYYVVAVYETGVSAPSNTVTALIEVLYPPSNLSYMTNDDDVILIWDAAPISSRGFLGYNVYRDGMFIALVNALTYTDAALANGTYQYFVTAIYDSGESLPTNTVIVNLEVLYPATNLSAIVNGDDVTLNWSAAATSGGLRSFIAYKVMRENVEIAQTTSLTYLDADLSNGIYQYTIIASYDSGDALASNQVEVLVEVLYQPTNLSYMVVGDRVDLSWIAAPNSARALLGYNVYRDGNLIALEQTLNYSDLDLANGVYQYYVTALYGSGESLPTNTVTATVEVLYPPTVLTYSVSDDDVTLYWNAAATSGGLRAFLGYNIYRDGSLISQTMSLSYVDNNLVNGVYQYHVTALYDSGESDPTNSVNVLVEVFYPATNLTHLVNGDDVSLNWTAAVNLRAIQGYKIYRDDIEIAQVIGTDYLDSDLSNGIYDYYVVAVYETGVSAPSNTVTALIEVLYPPSNLSYMTNDDDVILIWDAAPISSRGFLGYNVYRDGMFIALVNALTYTDAALANGTYQYFVTALYDSGESLPTNTVIVNLEVLYPATNLSANVNGDDVTLFWSAAATSGGLRSFIAYKVMRDNVEIAQTTSLTYLDADLSNGIYQYTIIASYDSGDALASNQVEVLVEVLYQPTNLSYMVVGDRIDLSWIAVPNSARALLGYNVYRDGNLIALEQTLNYSDLDLANGIYQYYVTAHYGSGESLATNTVTATVEVLYPPTVLTYSVSDDDVTLYWNAAAISGGLRALLSYNVYRDGSLISQTMSLSYVDNNLVNGVYQYHVTALYDSGESDPTNSVNVLVEVYYPATDLTYIVNGDDVSLNWTAAVNSGGLRAIQGYNVYRDNTEIAQVIGTDYLDSDLANGIYDYHVVAVYETGVSAPSNTVTALVEVLYPPSNLIYSVDQNDVTLTWNPAPISGRGFLHYQIYRDGIALAQSNQTTFTDYDLANGIYQYYVTAVYDSGESSPTATVTVSVEVVYPVTALSASVIEDSVTLTWTLPAVNTPRAFLGYFIYRNNALQQVLDNPALTTWTDNGLANGDYSYYLVAVYDAGFSIPSNVVNVSINVQPDLFPPTNLTALLSGERDVILNWNAPIGNVQFYRVYRNALEIATTLETTYSDLNLANGSYDYYVKAQYAEGLSSATETATINIMIADPPTGLNAQVVSGNSVLLMWTAPAQGEIGFLIYRNGTEIQYIANPLVHQFTDSALANGSYLYNVAAVYSNVISNLSNTATALITMPYSPQQFALIADGSTVTLNWQPPLDIGGFSVYRIYRNGVYLAQTTLTNYTDSNLANGVYDYHITALYGSIESVPTPTLTANIGIAYAPADLIAISSANNVYLSWTHVSDMGGFTAYNVIRDGIIINQTTNNYYNDDALANGSYAYQASAVYTFGTSLPSNTANVTVEVLYPPTGLQTNVIDNDVYLSWTAAVTSGGLRDLQGYKIYRNNVMIGQTTETSYTDLDLNNGSYSYYVRAAYDSGDSAPTQTMNVLIEVLYPPSVLTHIVDGDSVELIWNAVPPSGATLIGYKVYRDGALITTTSNTSYTDSALNNGSYAYQVSAQYSSGESLPTNSIQAFVEVLYPPQNLVSSLVLNDVTLSWTAPANAANSIIGYQVFRDGVSIGTVTASSYIDLDLDNGNYVYYVKAAYNSGTSTASNSVDIDILIAYPPTDLSATLQGQNNVLLSWTAPNQTETGFVVYRDDQLIATITNPLTNTYLDQNLPNGLHSYRVGATYSGANSNLTDPVTINILVAYSPQNLTAQANGTTIQLNWNPPQDITLLNGYRIYHSINGTPQGPLNVTQNSYSFTDADNGLYSFHVTALYGTMPPYVESAASNTATATVFIAYAPLNLTATVTGDDVSLNWTPPMDLWGWQSYSVYRNGALIGTTTTPSYLDADLANGTYTYYVTAQYALGVSSPSNSVVATVLIAYAPPAAQVSVEVDDVLIQWTAPGQGETGFAVYRDDSMIISITDPSQLSYTDLDLPNDDYHYEVKAVYGSTLSASTNAGNAHVEVIYAPSNLQASVAGNVVNLTWTAVSDPGFFIQYRIIRQDVMIDTSTDTSYSDADLPNGQYTYAISAQYQSGDSDMITAAPVNVINAYPPLNLQISADENDVNLSWAVPMDIFGLSYYQVLRDGNVIGTVQSDLGYTDAGLSNGNYSYSVSAVYGGLEGTTPSQNISIILAYPPQNLVMETEANNVSLLWEAPTDSYGISSYRIYRNGVQVSDQSQIGFANTDLANGAYTYSVTAMYGSLESNPIQAQTTILIVRPVTNVQAQALQSGGYLIVWSAPPEGSNPDHYSVWFMYEEHIGDPTLWQFVASVSDSLSILDLGHNHITEGRLVWAVTVHYGDVYSDAAFSNVIELEPDVPPIPEITKLIGNYPNPFNPNTRISFWIKESSPVTLVIYNQRGQVIRKLLNANMEAGTYNIPWDGKDDLGRTVNSGIYLYRLVARGYSKSAKMVLMK